MQQTDLGNGLLPLVQGLLYETEAFPFTLPNHQSGMPISKTEGSVAIIDSGERRVHLGQPSPEAFLTGLRLDFGTLKGVFSSP